MRRSATPTSWPAAKAAKQLMIELIAALELGGSFYDIKGLSFARDGQPVHNEPRGQCTVLDELPFPDLST